MLRVATWERHRRKACEMPLDKMGSGLQPDDAFEGMNPESAVQKSRPSPAIDCPWCGSSFAPRGSGGKPQRFCSPRCRREHEAGLQAWARDQEAAGRVTRDDIQRARWPDA